MLTTECLISKLPDFLAPVFQVIPHRDHELVGVGTVDDEVVVSKSQTDEMTDGDGVIAVLVREDYRFFEQAAHAQDCQLWLVDDWCPELRTEDARVGDGNRATLHFVRQELL